MSSNTGSLDGSESHSRPELATPSVSIAEINHGDELTSSNSVILSLLKPTAMESNGLGQKDELLKVHTSKTYVNQLKSHISTTWPGKPKIDGIRLIARGRILDDSEIVGAALCSSPGDNLTHPIHVVVKPSAWTEKIAIAPLPARPMSAPPTAAVETSAQVGVPPPVSTLLHTPLPSASASFNLPDPFPPTYVPGQFPSRPSSPGTTSTPSPHHAIFKHFQNLTRPQRLQFIENLYKAQFNLVERLEVLRLRLYQNQVEGLGLQKSTQKAFEQEQAAKEEDERWKPIDDKLTKLLADLQYWGTYVEPYEPAEFHEYQIAYQNYLHDGPSEFERVEIGGLPFLLHIPRNFQQQAHQEAFMRNLATRTPPSPHVMSFRNLKKEMNRALHLEKRLHVLILQVKKLETTLNQVESFLASSNVLTGTTSLASAQQAAPGMPGRPLAGPPAALFQAPPNGHLGLMGMGAPNPPMLNLGAPGAAVGAGGAGGAGFGIGVGANGLFQMPADWMMPANGAAWPHPMGRTRRYEFTINLDSIRRYLAPLLWLSFKLSLLLYVFGRHASFNKRVVLIGMAVGWVFWEALAIGQRVEAQVRRRERLQRQQAGGVAGAAGPVDPVQAVLDRGRRRAERDRAAQRLRDQRLPQRDAVEVNNFNPPPVAPDAQTNPVAAAAPQAESNVNLPPNPPVNAPPNPAPVQRPPSPVPAIEAPVAAQRPGRRNLRALAEDIRARGGAFPPGTEVRPFRTTSALSPKYWFNSIAVVGLASEYRELGLHPIGERSLGSSNNSDYPRWYKALRNMKVCLILFIGTLLPEIEKKRKKALEKRTRILNMVIADAAREREGRNIRIATRLPENPVPLVPIPARTPEAAQTSESRAPGVEPSVTETASITPSVVTASGVDLPHTQSSSGSTLISRHAPNPSKSTEKTPTLLDRPETEGYTLPNVPATSPAVASTSIQPPTVVHPPSPGRSATQPSAVTIPASGSGGPSDDRLAPTTPRAEDPALLESPLTPLNERPLVPGLDDTDDEDLIAAGEDEAGMMLF